MNPAVMCPPAPACIRLKNTGIPITAWSPGPGSTRRLRPRLDHLPAQFRQDLMNERKTLLKTCQACMLLLLLVIAGSACSSLGLNSAAAPAVQPIQVTQEVTRVVTQDVTREVT